MPATLFGTRLARTSFGRSFCSQSETFKDFLKFYQVLVVYVFSAKSTYFVETHTVMNLRKLKKETLDASQHGKKVWN